MISLHHAVPFINGTFTHAVVVRLKIGVNIVLNYVHTELRGEGRGRRVKSGSVVGAEGNGINKRCHVVCAIKIKKTKKKPW